MVHSAAVLDAREFRLLILSASLMSLAPGLRSGAWTICAASLFWRKLLVVRDFWTIAATPGRTGRPCRTGRRSSRRVSFGLRSHREAGLRRSHPPIRRPTRRARRPRAGGYARFLRRAFAATQVGVNYVFRLRNSRASRSSGQRNNSAQNGSRAGSNGETAFG